MMSYVLRNSGLSSIKFLCATLSHMSIVYGNLFACIFGDYINANCSGSH